MSTTLRTTKVSVHLAYRGTSSNNLFAENTSVAIDDAVIVSFDLNCNLRKNKETNTYMDARDLLEGDISDLEEVQIDDETTTSALINVLRHARPVPDAWRLILLLDGTHEFVVQVDRKQLREQNTLRLTVPNSI